jgi:hypothetical protein
MLIIVSEWRVQGVQVVFPTAGRFVQGVQTIFHYCGTLCTGCTSRFPLLRDALYRVYEPFSTTAGRFVQGVRAIFHYCGTFCTGCTSHSEFQYFNVSPRLHRVGSVERSLLYGGQGVCFPLTAFVTDLILFWPQSTGEFSGDKKYLHFSHVFFPFSHLFFAFSRLICERTDGFFLAQRSSLCR